MSVLVVLLVVIGIILAMYVGIYNGLVQARQKVKEAWSGIDVQLKRRHDLIPNLIKTVREYAAHEKDILESVTKARAAAIAVPDSNVANKGQAENALTGTLKSLFAISENYPDLKSNENYLHLQEALVETEDQIAASRRIYNGNVTNLNTKVQSFPGNLIAGVHGFTESEFFELEAEEKEAVKQTPKVEF